MRTLCHTVPRPWMMEGIGFYCGIVMRWFRDAFCELEAAEASADRRGRVQRDGAQGARASRRGSNGIVRDLLERDAGEPLGPRLARFIGFDVAQPRALRPRRVLPRDRGERRLRHPRPPADHRGADGHRRRRGGAHRWRREGQAVAADLGRHARDPDPYPGRQGIDRARRGDLRRASGPACTKTRQTRRRPTRGVRAD